MGLSLELQMGFEFEMVLKGFDPNDAATLSVTTLLLNDYQHIVLIKHAMHRGNSAF